MNKNIIAILIGLLLTFGVYVYTQQEVETSMVGGDSHEVVFGFKGLVTATDFAEKTASGEYVILDIRTSEEYIQQRIGDDALSMDFYAADFREHLDTLDKSKKYLLHCKSGGRSSKAVKIMQELGFEEFYELKGGINSWDKEGLPTYSGKAGVPTTLGAGSGQVSIPEEDILPPAEPMECTMDAMQCPDGSYVGRTGPDCEFVCPEVKEEEKKPLSMTEASSLDWWKPTVGLSWQWQLSGEIDTSYDVDVYDIDLEETPQSVIDELHTRGIKVICYISAGSWEDWRSDADDFPSDALGKDYEGWPGEKWLDVSNYKKFEDVMLARLDMAAEKKCDAIEPDNIHGYQEDTGFSLTYADQLQYNIWLAEESHKRGLAIAIKNDGEQVRDLIEYYDFAIVEECFQWEECAPYTDFIHVGKPVFGVEYGLSRSQFCLEAEELQFSWLEMEYDLDGGRKSCDDVSA